MQCQKCGKSATFHITEVIDGTPKELHLCEEHARDYLAEASEQKPGFGNIAAAMAQHVAEQMGISQTSQELQDINEKSCEVCGISFFEFRSTGRLGCPCDYAVFEEQLSPLLLNIHGSLEYVGKKPGKSEGLMQERSRLIQIRHELEEAVACENYERAAELKKMIEEMEG